MNKKNRGRGKVRKAKRQNKGRKRMGDASDEDLFTTLVTLPLPH